MAGDALSLPFPDATFDRVICSEVLEHIPDDRGAMREILRVLRPGGTAAVTVPRFGARAGVLGPVRRVPPHSRRPRAHLPLVGAVEPACRRPACASRGIGLAHGLHTPYWWLKCAVGVQNADHPLVKAYHRLLVWDIEAGRPLPTRLAEALLNPGLSKSLVVYLERPTADERRRRCRSDAARTFATGAHLARHPAA